VSKTKHHNLWLGVQNKKYINSDLTLVSIALMYLPPTGKRKEKTLKMNIPEKSWDNKVHTIKPNWEKKLEPELNRVIEIQAKIREYEPKIESGEIHWDRAKNEILGRKEQDNQTVMEYLSDLKQKKGLKLGTIGKYKKYLNALNNYCREWFGWDELTFQHLKDNGICEKIEEKVLELDCTSSGKRQYLVNAQAVYKRKNNMTGKKFRNFSLFDNIPTERKNPKPKKPVESKKFSMALNDINTLNQFEAVLFWLYSLSMLGLDGIDLINLDESNIVTEDFDDIDFYHPEVKRLNKKIHVEIIRSKLQEDEDDDYPIITRVVNTYPTRLLKLMLEHCIKINHPELAYKGKDRLKLFNFWTEDKNRMQNQDGLDKWEKTRKFYSDILRKKLGATVQFTRSTSSHLGYDIGVDVKVIDANLGHSNEVSKSMKHYLSEAQIKLDTYQLFTIQQFDIMKKMRQLIQMFGSRYESVNGKRVRYIPEELMPVKIDALKLKDFTETKDGFLVSDKEKISPKHLNNNLIYQPLSRWSMAEESRYQTLMRQMNSGDGEYNELTGKMEETVVEPENYPDELKQLIRRKEEFSKTYIKETVYDKINQGEGVKLTLGDGETELSHN